MIAKKVATLLRMAMEYGEDIKEQDLQYAKVNGAVVVFGASDDLMEFRGAIEDEIDCYEGGEAHIDKNGVIVNKCDNEDCPYFQKKILHAKVITAIWDSEGYDWIYQTEIPHETFDILEKGEKYCRGIVFLMEDI